MNQNEKQIEFICTVCSHTCCLICQILSCEMFEFQQMLSKDEPFRSMVPPTFLVNYYFLNVKTICFIDNFTNRLKTIRKCSKKTTTFYTLKTTVHVDHSL